MNFLESIKKIFQEKTIHINISLVQKENENDTDYLLSTPANASSTVHAK